MFCGNGGEPIFAVFVLQIIIYLLAKGVKFCNSTEFVQHDGELKDFLKDVFFSLAQMKAQQQQNKHKTWSDY